MNIRDCTLQNKSSKKKKIGVPQSDIISVYFNFLNELFILVFAVCFLISAKIIVFLICTVLGLLTSTL